MAGRTPCLVLASIVIALPASGQETLSPYTQVRITTSSGRFIEGRLVSGDSLLLTVATGDALVVLRRDSIATIFAAAIRSRGWAIGVGATMGVLTGLFGAALGASCDTPNCSAAPIFKGALVGGGFGLATGGVTGAVIGAFLHKWRQVPAAMRVAGRPVGAAAPESCASRSGVGAVELEAATGTYRTSRRLGLTLLCRSRLSLGAETGTLGYTTSDSSPPFLMVGTPATVTAVSRVTGFSFIGPFVEIPLHTSFNPRLVASAGYYRRIETTTTATYLWNGTAGQWSSSRSVNVSAHPGANLGLAMSMPLWRHLSLGADLRAHVIAGSGLIRTIGVTARVAP